MTIDAYPDSHLSTAGSPDGLEAPRSSSAARTDYLVDRVAWLVRLRWFAITGIFVTICAGTVTGVVPEAHWLFLVVLGMTLYNVGFQRVARRLGPVVIQSLETSIVLQIILDLVALTALIHFAGGPQNPFVLFFAFHMAIGAMLLHLRKALWLGLAAFVIHGSTVLAEFGGVIESYPLIVGSSLALPPIAAGQSEQSVYLIGYLLAFVAMIFGVIYFVASIAQRHRRSELLRAERERLAMSRERLAQIGEISAGVAHTIRNPLHGVLNCVELLGGGLPPDDPRHETLSFMTEGLHRIEGVTQRLLTLTRGDQPQFRRERLEGVVRDALRFVENKAKTKQVVVEQDLDRDHTVNLDPNRFSEALLNVVTNAIDACEPGQRVRVRTMHNGVHLDYVWVEVQDRGTGIPVEDLSRIFDPFFTTKPIGEGSGLGLAMTRKIMDEHGGSIAVESRVGVGTRVRLYLPRHLPEELDGGVSHGSARTGRRRREDQPSYDNSATPGPRV